MPREKVDVLEAWLEARWADRSWYATRGALVCSYGMLGLRWSEVARMLRRDLLVERGLLYVRTAKGGPPRHIDVPERLMVATLGWRSLTAAGGERVFVTRQGKGMEWVDQRRFTARVTLGVFGRRYTFHCFRHTAAERSYRRTKDVLQVQKFLGHKSLQWTQTYLSRVVVDRLERPVAFGKEQVFRPKVFDPDDEARAVEDGDAAAKPGAAAAEEELKGKAADGKVESVGERVALVGTAGGHDCLRELVPFRSARSEEGIGFGVCRICSAEFGRGHELILAV